MGATFFDNVADSFIDFFLVILSAFLSPLILVLDLFNIINFDISFGGSN